MSSELTAVVEPISLPANKRSLWAGTPALGEVPGGEFLGRVVAEIWENGASFFYQRLTDDEKILERAVSALDRGEPEQFRDSLWTNEPIMENLENQPFLGRVVVEVWDRGSYISIIGDESANLLISRALQRIREHL